MEKYISSETTCYSVLCVDYFKRNDGAQKQNVSVFRKQSICCERVKILFPFAFPITCVYTR